MRIWHRLMDAIEPEIMEQAESVIRQQPEVKDLRHLRMRWLGHSLHADVQIAVEPHLTTVESFDITEQLRHELYHHIDHLADVTVNVEPWSESADDYPRRFPRHTG